MATALITGASSGLGKCLADKYNKSGFDLILIGRNNKRLNEVYDELSRFSAGGTSVCAIQGDLTHDSTIREIEKISNVKTITHLVHAAACYNYSIFSATSRLDVECLLRTNLEAVIRVTQTVMPYMCSNRTAFQKFEPVIVNINSLSGKIAAMNEALYSATKFGLHGFFQALRLEQRDVEFPIRVLEVFPGGIQTPMTDGRSNYALLMHPTEVAEVIAMNAMSNTGSLVIDEIHLSRRR